MIIIATILVVTLNLDLFMGVERRRHNWNPPSHHHLRWEFIKENKNVRKQEKERKQEFVQESDLFFLVAFLVEFLFSCFLDRFLGRVLVFFYKFPPLTYPISIGSVTSAVLSCIASLSKSDFYEHKCKILENDKADLYFLDNMDRFPNKTMPRWNFTDFMHSFMIVFRVLCGEWIGELNNLIFIFKLNILFKAFFILPF